LPPCLGESKPSEAPVFRDNIQKWIAIRNYELCGRHQNSVHTDQKLARGNHYRNKDRRCFLGQVLFEQLSVHKNKDSQENDSREDRPGREMMFVRINNEATAIPNRLLSFLRNLCSGAHNSGIRIRTR
jgi:hypothetical protein